MEEVTERDRERYMGQLVPYGYLDINAAIQTAKEAGYDAEWAADQVIRIVDECDNKIENVDPVAEVYESILQEARDEIEQETEYDLCNDVKARTGIYTAGNYCVTSYDYSEEAIDELREILVGKEVDIDSLSEATQWFLKEIGIQKEQDNDKEQTKSKV